MCGRGVGKICGLPIMPYHAHSQVATIGEMAFFFCSSLAAVTMSNGTRKIGKKAFMNCTGPWTALWLAAAAMSPSSASAPSSCKHSNESPTICHGARVGVTCHRRASQLGCCLAPHNPTLPRMLLSVRVYQRDGLSVSALMSLWRSVPPTHPPRRRLCHHLSISVEF